MRYQLTDNSALHHNYKSLFPVVDTEDGHNVVCLCTGTAKAAWVAKMLNAADAIKKLFPSD